MRVTCYQSGAHVLELRLDGAVETFPKQAFQSRLCAFLEVDEKAVRKLQLSAGSVVVAMLAVGARAEASCCCAGSAPSLWSACRWFSVVIMYHWLRNGGIMLAPPHSTYSCCWQALGSRPAFC